MKTACLGSVLALLTGAGLALAQPPAAPERLPTPQPAAPAPAAGEWASQASQEKKAAPADSGIGVPWNPPVGHANVWPYDEPLQLGAPDCKPPGDFWLVPEFLLWGIKGFHVPGLATIGSPGVTLLGSGKELDAPVFPGGRITAGTWLDDCHDCGLEAGYFFVGPERERHEVLSSGTPGSPVLARPFLDARTGLPGALVVAGPGLGAGIIRTEAVSNFQGAPADLVWNVTCSCQYQVELLAGFRYQDLSEHLDIANAGSLPPAGRETVVVDQFGTHNIFYGADLGARAEYHWHHLVAGISGKLALGSNQESIHIVGTTLEAGRRHPGYVPAGLLALPGNTGRYHASEFAAIPELGLQLGWQFNPWVRAFVGYNFLYWGDVVRPGDQIDTTINPARVPALHGTHLSAAPARPEFSRQEADFWAQGLNVGAEVRY